MAAVADETDNRRNDRKHRPVIDNGKWHEIIEFASIFLAPLFSLFETPRADSFCAFVSKVILYRLLSVYFEYRFVGVSLQ